MAQTLLVSLVFVSLIWKAVADSYACVDDDAKWASFGSTCAKMEWQCDTPGYGTLVQRWCPRTCGLCSPTSPDDGSTDDIVAFTSTSYESNSLELTLTRKGSGNITSVKGGRSANASDPNFTIPSPPNSTVVEKKASEQAQTNLSVIVGFNATQLDENATLIIKSEELQITHDPPKWEIILPFKDAVADVSKANSFPARAIWSPDQEHFVFEFSNDSAVGNASEEYNSSTTPLEAERSGNSHSLQEEEGSGCPDGYEQVSGHIYGGDQYGRGYDLIAPTIAECGRWCTQTPGCGSIEYSKRSGRCFRNSQTRPTNLENRPEYILCRRAPCPSLLTEAACVGPAVTPGWLSEEVKLRPGSYCIWSAGRCQAPMTCTYEDCFLPDGGLPGMDLPPSKTLWISRAGLLSTMAKTLVL